MALDLHVDLHRHRVALPELRNFLAQLQAGFIHAARHSRCVADGASLFLFRPKALRERSLQSAAETGVHVGHRSGNFVRAHRISHLETSSVLMAGVADGGFRWARLWHFAVMWAILAFLFGHLVMVVLHGWNNFVSMLTGWKKDPEYL